MRRPYDVVFSMPWAAPLLLDETSSIAVGGAERQMVLVAEGLAARGLRVAVAAVAPRGGLPSRHREVEILRQPPSPRRRGIAGPVHDAATMFTLSRHRARCVVQRNASRNVAAAAVAAKARGARFVYSSANVIDFDFGRLERRHTNVRLYEWGVRRSDEIVVQTDEQAEMCRRRFGRDARVIRSIARPIGTREAEPEAFLWIGRLVSYKRPEVYVELARAVPEATFRMVAAIGDAEPDLASWLGTAAAQTPNLEVLAPRPHARLMELVSRSVAIVSTSDYEGMPNVLLEGFARGVPALAFSHDPDGIVERHRLGAVAGGEFERLAAHAREMWRHRDDDQADLAQRCLAYLSDHHNPEVALDGWAVAVGADGRG